MEEQEEYKIVVLDEDQEFVDRDSMLRQVEALPRRVNAAAAIKDISENPTTDPESIAVQYGFGSWEELITVIASDHDLMNQMEQAVGYVKRFADIAKAVNTAIHTLPEITARLAQDALDHRQSLRSRTEAARFVLEVARLTGDLGDRPGELNKQIAAPSLAMVILNSASASANVINPDDNTKIVVIDQEAQE